MKKVKYIVGLASVMLVAGCATRRHYDQGTAAVLVLEADVQALIQAKGYDAALELLSKTRLNTLHYAMSRHGGTSDSCMVAVKQYGEEQAPYWQGFCYLKLGDKDNAARYLLDCIDNSSGGEWSTKAGKLLAGIPKENVEVGRKMRKNGFYTRLTQKDLDKAFNKADRVVVREGYGVEYPALYDSKDRKDITALRDALRIRKPTPLLWCTQAGTPVIYLYSSAGGKSVWIADHHGSAIHTSLWNSAAQIGSPDAWRKWFLDRKIKPAVPGKCSCRR